MLALCWAHVGPPWVYVAPMLGLCWAYVGQVGTMLGLYCHVEPKFGNFADLRSLEKLEK